jgi:hypothetical protein
LVKKDEKRRKKRTGEGDTLRLRECRNILPRPKLPTISRQYRPKVVIVDLRLVILNCWRILQHSRSLSA